MTNKNIIQKKLCLIGDFAVGKTSLIRRFVFNQFEEKYLTTIGVHISKKEIEFDECIVKLLIWDIAGEDGFHRITPTYLAGATGAILVGDVSRPQTIQNIQKHEAMVRKIATIKGISVALNKIDLLKSESIGQEIVNSHSFLAESDVSFTSSLTGDRVENIFRNIAIKLISSSGSI